MKYYSPLSAYSPFAGNAGAGDDSSSSSSSPSLHADLKFPFLASFLKTLPELLPPLYDGTGKVEEFDYTVFSRPLVT